MHANHGSFGGLTTATVAAVERARRWADANPMGTWARRHDDAGGTRCRAIEDALAAIGVEAKLTPFGGRAVLRLSAHAYTSARDHDRLADALAAVVTAG